MKPAREKPFPNETALSVACQKRIRVEHSGAVLKVHGSAMQRKGEPDLLASVPVSGGGLGRFCAIELKQPGKVPTSLQYKRLRDYAAAGALAGYVTTEVELDELLSHRGDPSWVNEQLATTVGTVMASSG